MTQSNFETTRAATYVGIESTYGTTPTMTRAFPVAGTLVAELSQAELDNMDESIYLFDQKDTVRGNQEGTCKFEMQLAPALSALSSSATAATPWFGSILKALLGGETAAAGSIVSGTVAGVPTSASFAVDPGHGSRFAIGQWVLVASASALYPGRVTNISTDTLSFNPYFTGAPASGSSVVYNMFNYYPTQENSLSLTLQHAKAANSTFQWTLNGCTGDVELKLERNKLATAAVSLKVAKHTGPSDQSITTTAVSQSVSPFVMNANTVTLVQTTTTNTRTQYALESLALKFNGGMVHVPVYGGTQGTSGVMRTGERCFAEGTLKFAADSVADTTWWANQTKLQVIVMAPSGTGLTQRWLVIDMPTVEVVGKPKFVSDGNRMLCEMTVKTLLNQISTSQSTDLSRSPFVIAMG